MDPYPFIVARAGLALVKGHLDEAIKYFIILSGMEFSANKTLGYIYMIKDDNINAAKYFIEYCTKYEDRKILFTIGELLKDTDIDKAQKFYIRAAKLNCVKSIFQLAEYVPTSNAAKLLFSAYGHTFTYTSDDKRILRVIALNKLAMVYYNNENISQFIEIVEAMKKYKDFDFEEHELTDSFRKLFVIYTEFRGFINLEAAIKCGEFLVKYNEREYLYFIGLIYYGLSYPCMSNCIDSCEEKCFRDNTFHCKKHCRGPPTSDEKSLFGEIIDYVKVCEYLKSVDNEYLTESEIKNKERILSRISRL